MKLPFLIPFRNFGYRDLLESDEVVLHAFRKRSLSFLGKGFLFFVLFFGLSYLVFFLFREEGVWGAILFALLGIWRVLYVFFSWYHNVVLMTNSSLIFVEWKNFFNKKSSRLDYSALDSIEVEKIGLRSYLENYGNLIFKKTGGGSPYKFHSVRKPQQISKIIEKYKEKKIDDKNFTEESALKDLLSKIVKQHVKEYGVPERKKSERLSQSIPSQFSSPRDIVEVEKELDDEGGIEIDLEEKS